MTGKFSREGATPLNLVLHITELRDDKGSRKICGVRCEGASSLPVPDRASSWKYGSGGNDWLPSMKTEYLPLDVVEPRQMRDATTTLLRRCSGDPRA